MDYKQKCQLYFKKARRYRAEIIISVFSIVFGTILGKLTDTVLSAPTIFQVILGLLSIIVFLLIGQLLLIKRNVTWKILTLQERVNKIPVSSVPSQYDERKGHFWAEKYCLIENLIRKVLPAKINELLNQSEQDNQKIVVVVDSGTTLEQFFPKAKLLGFGINNIDLKQLMIYTNSLSGSDAFCKISGDCVKEEQLHLFGGTQIEKYRAVLGDVTTKSMKTVREKIKNNSGVIIGLITANWLLVGNSYDKMIFCSTEPLHLDYKRCLAEISDVLIIVAPLGKLLKLDTVGELNTILKLKEERKPVYQSINIKELGKRNRENTILMTTFRENKSSILLRHSRDLLRAYERKSQKIYELCVKNRYSIIDHPFQKEDQIEIEMPHKYLREHAFEVLGILNN